MDIGVDRSAAALDIEAAGVKDGGARGAAAHAEDQAAARIDKAADGAAVELGAAGEHRLGAAGLDDGAVARAEIEYLQRAAAADPNSVRVACDQQRAAAVDEGAVRCAAHLNGFAAAATDRVAARGAEDILLPEHSGVAIAAENVEAA